MKAGWKSVTVGDVCKVIAGQSPPGSAYNQDANGLPFYQGKKDFGAQDIGAPTTWTTEVTKVAENGDILMSVRAPVGPVNFLNEKACIGRGLAAIRVGKDINRQFLFYNLWMRQADIGGKEGAVFASINRAEIEQIEIPLPPLEEQRRIVAVLDEAFAAIAQATANAEKNLANARELFASALALAFDGEAKGWPLVRMGAIGKTLTGNTPKTSNSGNFGNYISFIKPGDFRPNGSLEYDNEALSEEGAKGSRLIPAGSALMVCIGATIGKAGYAEQQVAANQQVNALIPDTGVSGKFVFYQFLTSRFQSAVLSASGQATLPIINKSKWTDLEIYVPDREDEQHATVKLLDRFILEREALETAYTTKIAALERLKQSLLHRAFTGELTTTPELLPA